MLLSMKDVDEHLDDYFSNWVDNYPKLASAYLQYFFPCYYFGTPDVAIQFIFLAQALESLHREGSIDTTICRHRPKLAKRIREIRSWLASKHASLLEVLVEDWNEFANKVKNTRNLLTHDPLAEREAVIKSPLDRWLYIQKMRLLLEICFLKEMGVPPDKIDELMRRNRRFLRIAQVADGR